MIVEIAVGIASAASVAWGEDIANAGNQSRDWLNELSADGYDCTVRKTT